MTAALSHPSYLQFTAASQTQFSLSSGSSLKTSKPCLLSIKPKLTACKGTKLSVQASSQRSGSSAGTFFGGFVLGGIIIGTLSCIYAPQISKALDAADRKDLMRKLPKFIYDEDKALENRRKILTEKIALLDSAIDKVSTELQPNNASNGTARISDEIIEASA